MLDINKFVVLKDCMYYEGTHKYYIFQFDGTYTLLADTNRAILYRAEGFADMIKPSFHAVMNITDNSVPVIQYCRVDGVHKELKYE